MSTEFKSTEFKSLGQCIDEAETLISDPNFYGLVIRTFRVSGDEKILDREPQIFKEDCRSLGAILHNIQYHSSKLEWEVTPVYTKGA